MSELLIYYLSWLCSSFWGVFFLFTALTLHSDLDGHQLLDADKVLVFIILLQNDF